MDIYVVKSNVLFGILSEENRVFQFVYSDKITSDCYLTGLRKKENSSGTLFPVFEDLIPENTDNIKLLKTKHKIRYDIEIFLYLKNMHGSFEFYSSLDDIALSNSFTFNYNDVKHEILDDYTYPNILSNYKLKVSGDILTKTSGQNAIGLSGYQYKFAVAKDDQTHVIQDTEEPTDFFIKPFNLDFTDINKKKFPYKSYKKNYFPYLLINEHIFMSLAKKFGFDTPYNALIKDPKHDEYHLIVKRFDRYRVKYKIDHYTFNSLLGNISKDKYDTKFHAVINCIKNMISYTEMETLFKFIVFSIIISHGDLHAKNLSLIYNSNRLDEKSMGLAPIYDVLTTKIYANQQNKNDIAIALRNNKKSEITLEDILDIAGQMDINATQATTIIDDLCNKFLNSFQEHIPDFVTFLQTKKLIC